MATRKNRNKPRTLELGLSRLEVAAANEGLVVLGEVDDTRNERVLGCAVDKRLTLNNGSNSEGGRRGDFRVRRLDGCPDIVCGIGDTRDNIAAPLGVRSKSKEYNDTIELVVRLELANI